MPQSLKAQPTHYPFGPAYSDRGVKYTAADADTSG
jgi:hypothetical protein